MKSQNITIGILADVDAGKTTLSENILYSTGSIRKAGRVDHGDTFLDTDAMEKERGITIFSKQALFTAGGKNFTLLDTPGHADFCAETERTLSVLDLCILVISAPDGLKSHVYTLWRLIRRYRIPCFLFINKTDIYHGSIEDLIKELNEKLSDGFIKAGSELYGEETAMLSEDLMEKYLEGGEITKSDVIKLINEGLLHPVVTGSALKGQGIDELLSVIGEYTEYCECPEEFGARVFKITRDKNERLTHLKITGGVLTVKDTIGESKINEIRLYQGDTVKPLQKAYPGMTVAVTGLPESFSGMGIGSVKDTELPVLVPLFSVTVVPSFDIDNQTCYNALKELEEEIPELSVDPYSGKGDLRIKLMGDVQTEIIKRIMHDRFNMDITFSENSIVYKETICDITEGVGHFEPLRHYSEVHLLLTPQEPGSGLTFDSALSTDVLPGHYQRLILSELSRHRHKGVLTGAELTDVKITLINGRHHIKHTVGGDFRQASMRAVRHGLMKNTMRLLEPYYDFEIVLPQINSGRAMSDITSKLCGTFEGPESAGDMAVLTGRAPVKTIQNYQSELTAYTKGFGRLNLTFAGYFPCHNPEEVTLEAGYDPDADLREPSGSVFCTHGAGQFVPWQEVENWMHLPLGGASGNAYYEPGNGENTAGSAAGTGRSAAKTAGSGGYLSSGYDSDKELMEIFQSTMSRNRKPEEESPQKSARPANFSTFDTAAKVSLPALKKEFLLVDGYNIIHAWPELNELMNISLDGARQALLDILSNYQGFRGMTLIAVFDAYRVKGGKGSVEKYAGIYAVYTKEAETADAYIEKTVHEIGHKHNVTVATSDALEQVIVFGEGAARMSAKEFYDEVKGTLKSISEICDKRKEPLMNRIKI